MCPPPNDNVGFLTRKITLGFNLDHIHDNIQPVLLTQCTSDPIESDGSLEKSFPNEAARRAPNCHPEIGQSYYRKFNFKISNGSARHTQRAEQYYYNRKERRTITTTTKINNDWWRRQSKILDSVESIIL